MIVILDRSLTYYRSIFHSITFIRGNFRELKPQACGPNFLGLSYSRKWSSSTVIRVLILPQAHALELGRATDRCTVFSSHLFCGNFRGLDLRTELPGILSVCIPMVYKGGGCALPDWTTSCQLIVFLIPRLSSSSMATSTWSEAPPSQILILSISMKVQLLDNQKCPIRRWVKFFSLGFKAYRV